MPDASSNRYADLEGIAGSAAADHRAVVGGLWDELGQLQLDFLRSRGLRPEHFLIDIGCGCFRAGVKLIPFLEPGHYFGLDLNESLIAIGYEREVVPAGLAERFPRANAIASDCFDLTAIEVRFDFALAQSVFTHVPWNDIRLCLEKAAVRMVAGGMFFATYFELAEGQPSGEPRQHSPAGITTYGNRDPFHYRVSDFRFACAGLPWKVAWHGDWGHPRGQRMICFQRA